MLDLKRIQFEQEEFLKDHEIYKKLLEREGKKFYFLDGPPYANDVPHIGHLRIKIIKDIIIRFKFMQGYKVYFRPGFDTHGLPIENAVEKKLNLKHKKEIEALGEKFLDICKKNATLNKDLWMQVYKDCGILYFLKEPYLTYENYYIESAWWTFKRWWEKGFVYKGYKPVHYCSHCQTSLAGYEVTDSYTTLKDPSIYVLFKLKEKVRGKEAYMLVWTTTPWTLASNVALAIREDAKYSIVKLSDGRIVILAKDRINVLSEIGYGFEVIEDIDGKELIGLSYEPVLAITIQKKLEEMKKENPKIHTIIASIRMLKERVASKTAAKKEIKPQDIYEDFVNLEEGTGVVHTAGGHGKTDYEISLHYALPAVSPLDEEARFNEEGDWLKGIYVKDADSKIIKYLEEKNLLLHSTYISHKYPVCWRCKTPLIIKLNEQYFVSIKAIKRKMIEELKKINFMPEFVRERMFNWIINAEDWNISRQRYWGIPMPIWECEKCKEVKVISGIREINDELRKIGKSISNFDLHHASKIELVCDSCNGKMKRVPYIFDVWFDSSIAAWASLGYPYYDNDLFEELWQVDRINEGQDQIRGWFYVLLFSGVATFDKSPYKSLSMVGWVLDEKGQKMSKSLGNVIYAKDAVEKLGADLLRFYMIYDTPPYNTQLINLESAYKEPLKFFNTLYNLYKFYSQIGPAEKLKKEIEDVWLISRTNRLIKEYVEAIERFELSMGLRKLYNFVVNDFSRDYIKLIREKAENKKNLIKETLKVVLKLLYPISPFFSDWLWQKVKDEKDEISLVLERLPKFYEDLINDDIERKFDLLNKIVQACLCMRAEQKINLRFPISTLFIFVDDKKVEEEIKEIEDVIKKRVNVKKVEIKKLKDVTTKAYKVDNFFIDLDFRLTESLIVEGFVREIIRHIQNARKKLKLVKENIIDVEIILDEDLKKILDNQAKAIKEKVNARQLSFNATAEKFDLEEEFFVRDKKIRIRIKRIG
jgi:isoleucyl-tRNA synthetase